MVRAQPVSGIPASIPGLTGHHLERLPQNSAGTPDADLLCAVLAACGEGVVLCDADDVVMVNAVAARIAPELVIGRPASRGATAALFDRDCPAGETRRRTCGDQLIQVRREAFGVAYHAWYLRDVSPTPAELALRAEHRRTEFLVEAGRRLSASFNTRRCARAAAELAGAFLADVAIVVFPPIDHHKARWLRATAGSPRLEEGSVSTSAAAEVPGLTEALTGFPPVPSRRLDPAQVAEWLLPAGFGPAGHALVTPLPGNEVPAGALVLILRENAPPFDQETETLVRVFATRAGAAISAAVLYQEQSATNAILTGDLLPPKLPVLEQAELAGSLRASQQAGLIGGDFYDLYRPGADSPEQELLVTLGDVCGKGARAAVLAGRIRHSLRALLLLENRPERLIELINRALLASTMPDPYVTLVLGTIRPVEDGHVHVRLIVAGHPEPLILRADGRVEEITAHGSMLGVLEDIDLTPVTVDLAPGELCLLYSDGITEAFGGSSGREMYGTERLKAALAACTGMPAGAVVERLEQLSTDWIAHGDQDDRALLAIRAVPRRPRSVSPE